MGVNGSKGSFSIRSLVERKERVEGVKMRIKRKRGKWWLVRAIGADDTWQDKEKREGKREGRKRTRVGSGVTLSGRGTSGTNDGGAATSPLRAEDVGGLAVGHLRTRANRLMSKKRNMCGFSGTRNDAYLDFTGDVRGVDERSSGEGDSDDGTEEHD